MRIAHEFSFAIRASGINPRYNDLTKKIVELHDINKKAQNDIKSSVVIENRFIDSLTRPSITTGINPRINTRIDTRTNPRTNNRPNTRNNRYR